MHTSKLMFINKLTTAKDMKTCCKEVRHLEINHILSYHMRITIESAMLVFLNGTKVLIINRHPKMMLWSPPEVYDTT